MADPEVENETAIACVRTAGFRPAGVARQYLRDRFGVWKDGLLLDLLADTGDARRDLVQHVENMRRNFDMSLAGTVLMEEPHNPRLIALFRQRMVHPRRQIIRDSIEKGIERGEIRPDLDSERILDYLLGALFAAVLTQGRPDPDWSQHTIDAIWPALSNQTNPGRARHQDAGREARGQRAHASSRYDRSSDGSGTSSGSRPARPTRSRVAQDRQEGRDAPRIVG